LLALDAPGSLKERLLHQVLEIRTGVKDPYLFDNIPGVLYSSFFGYKHRLIVKDIESTSSLITRRAELQGSKNFLLEEVEPSMEDLFVYLTEIGT